MWNNQDRKRTFQTWADMKSRCLNPRCHNYHNYGGRGIAVCERWMKSFSNFFIDMGVRPIGLTLERNDTNGNYEPSNCRWASRAEQRVNQRDCMYLTMGGDTKTPEQWSREVDLNADTIRKRKRRGMSDVDALTCPRMSTNQHLAARAARPASGGEAAT